MFCTAFDMAKEKMYADAIVITNVASGFAITVDAKNEARPNETAVRSTAVITSNVKPTFIILRRSLALFSVRLLAQNRAIADPTPILKKQKRCRRNKRYCVQTVIFWKYEHANNDCSNCLHDGGAHFSEEYVHAADG
jgi:hypothetical protein